MLHRFKETGHKDFSELPKKACFQMNDTHPTIAVAELMRLLIDQEGLDWDKAWGITKQVGRSCQHTALIRADGTFQIGLTQFTCHGCFGQHVRAAAGSPASLLVLCSALYSTAAEGALQAAVMPDTSGYAPDSSTISPHILLQGACRWRLSL